MSRGETPHQYRSFLVPLCLVIPLLACIAPESTPSASRKDGKEATEISVASRKTESGRPPGEEVPAAEQALIEADNDVFALYQKWQNSHGPRGALIERRIRRIVSDMKPVGPLTDAVELCQFDYRRLDEDRGRLSFVFRVLKDIPDDYLVSVHAYAEDADVPALPASRQPYKFMNWDFYPASRTNEWWPTPFAIVTKDLVNVPPVPLHIYSGLLATRWPFKKIGENVDLGIIQARTPNTP